MALNEIKFNIRTNQEGKEEIFDYWRKKFVALTPEEWVRQQFLKFLVTEKGYPQSLIAVEKLILVNRLSKRFDAVVYNQLLKPVMLIEFKAPTIALSQKTMEQAGRYNLSLKVNYLVISNGAQHYCCKIDHQNETILFLTEIPEFNQLIG